MLRDTALQNTVFTAQRKTFQVLMTKTQDRLKTVLGPMLNQSWVKVKVKVKFALEQTTKRREGAEVQLYFFFNLGARWRWVVTPRPGLFTPPPGKRPVTHCTGGWVGPSAGLDTGKSRPHRDSIPGPSSPYESLYRLNYRSPQNSTRSNAKKKSGGPSYA